MMYTPQIQEILMGKTKTLKNKICHSQSFLGEMFRSTHVNNQYVDILT